MYSSSVVCLDSEFFGPGLGQPRLSRVVSGTSMFIFMTIGPVIGPLLKIEIRIREVNGNVL